VYESLDGVAADLRARWLLDAISGLVGLVSPSGTILELNSVGRGPASLSRAEAAGRKLWELDGWYVTDRARHRTRRAVARAARSQTTQLELVLPDAAGVRRTFDVVLKPVHDSRGRVSQLLLEGRDVTDLRTAEGATIRHNAELQELADRLRAADAQRRRLIADVTHERKTPLRITIGLLDRVLHDSVLPAPARRDVVAARGHANGMQVQIDELLTAARLEAGQLELVTVPCDLADLVRRVAAGFESVATAHGAMMDVLTPQKLVVIADQHRVASAITNLISNALKATPPEGRVRVELRERRRKACLEVSDTGPGVPARLREAIFERFQQGVRQGTGGSGIGLALVNEIVAMHGGSVSISTAPEGGALFRLEFPLAPPGSAAIPPPDIAAVVRPSRERLRGQLSRRANTRRDEPGDADERPRMVLVEDNVDFALLLMEQLSARYTIHHVGTAEEALQELEHRQPDVLLTDVALPGMSGASLVEELRGRSEYDHLPIVALSGEPDADMAERLLRAGAEDFVAKPFTVPALAARVDGILARRAQELTARETAALAGAWFEHAPLGIGLLETDGRWQRANSALCALLGYSQRELSDKTLDELTAPEDIGVERELLEDALAGRTRGFQVEKRLRRADGVYVWTLLSVAAVSQGDRGQRLIVHVDDVGERRLIEDRLRRAAARDELTGLSSRRKFERRLARHLRGLRGGGALLLLDIDDFAALNRRHGRAAGDRVLRALGRAVAISVPRGAPAGRVDGDRIAVLLARADRAEVLDVAGRLLDAARGCQVRGRGGRIRLSASVGGTMLAPGTDLDAAFAGAEKALGAAKGAGGGSVSLPQRPPGPRGSAGRTRATSVPRHAGR
jgi:PAS domain S-box-containing protein/diguanylate cyclase (GGDEF)-like protein